MFSKLRTIKACPPHKQEWQLLDLLQISRQENEIKNAALGSIRDLRHWKKNISFAWSPALQAHSIFLTLLMRRRARVAVRAYYFIRNRRKQIFHNYIAGLPKIQHCKRLVS